MNVSELFVRCLENEGVRYIFGLPGEENLDFMDALSGSQQIHFVTTRHEQGAAFMANVYGRLSTYPGVCLSTLGPGATNLITGVADAQLDRVPLGDMQPIRLQWTAPHGSRYIPPRALLYQPTESVVTTRP